MNQFEIFFGLHHSKEPLLLANAWDVSSAKLSEANGFSAIATSSAAIADTMGYMDGEHIPFDLLLDTAKRIRKHTSLPLTVDIEKGYSRELEGITENIKRLYDIGVAGINIEDELAKDKKELVPLEEFEKKLSGICNLLSQKNMHVFINVRTDAFLRGLEDPLTETIQRAKRYENTGVHGIFVPFVKEESDIKAIVNATKLPLNVLAMGGLPGITKLSSLGVKRISMGSSLYRAMIKDTINKIQRVQREESFDCLFE